MKRVLVVGAGAVGLTLARFLSSSGIDVTIYESKASVSQEAAKASGIFSKSGLARLGIDYTGAVLNTLDGAIIHGGGESFSVRTPDAKAYVVDRGKFADICAKEARNEGAKIIFNKRLSKSELAELSKDEDLIIVGADGAVSSVASAFGFPEIGEYILTYKAEYENARIDDIHKVGLFFSNKVSGRFFGWTVPYSKERLEVGIGVSSYKKQTSKSAFDGFVRSGELQGVVGGDGAKVVASYASIIPIQFRKRTVSGNVLLVGDAAGQVKATTGGGVIFGAACAKIASDVIIANITKGDSLSAYEKLWRRNYGLDLKLHRALHGYYSRLGERGFAVAIKMAKFVGFEKFLSEYGDMDSPSTMIKSFFNRKSP
jgi:flavin-dependent dehydrogenase